MKETTKRKPIYALSECAVMIAAALALSFVDIPTGILGGSISFVMVPLFIMCYRNGAAYGIPACLVYGLLKCIIGGSIGYGLPSVLLDYVLAYGACGLAGFFKGKSAFLEISVLIGCVARFAVHFISGVTIYKILVPTAIENTPWTFASPTVYSLVYNAIYMVPSTILAIAVISLLRIPLKKLGKIK